MPRISVAYLFKWCGLTWAKIRICRVRRTHVDLDGLTFERQMTYICRHCTDTRDADHCVSCQYNIEANSLALVPVYKIWSCTFQSDSVEWSLTVTWLPFKVDRIQEPSRFRLRLMSVIDLHAVLLGSLAPRTTFKIACSRFLQMDRKMHRSRAHPASAYPMLTFQPETGVLKKRHWARTTI